MTVTAAELAAERARDLRRLTAAVESAVYGGATDDEITAAIEAGVAAAEANPIIQSRRRAAVQAD